jgi:hypothetical protein
MDLSDPFGARQAAIGAQMLRNMQQSGVDRTAGQAGSVVSAATGGFGIEAAATVLETPSNAAAGLANLALPGGTAMLQGREPSEADLAYAPVRRQQVAGLKAALDPNLSIPERAVHGFAAVATTPVVIAEGLTWGAGGRAADAVGEHAYRAWTAPTVTDAGLHALQAGEEFLTAFVTFGSLAAPLSSKPVRARPGAPTRTNYSVYETIVEEPISGTTRPAHRAAANRNLLRQMQQDPEFASRMNDLFDTDVAGHMTSGGGRRLVNPPNTVWHHPVDNPDVLRLLRSSEHQNRLLKGVLHPDNVGGFGRHFGN